MAEDSMKSGRSEAWSSRTADRARDILKGCYEAIGAGNGDPGVEFDCGISGVSGYQVSGTPEDLASELFALGAAMGTLVYALSASCGVSPQAVMKEVLETAIFSYTSSKNVTEKLNAVTMAKKVAQC